MFFKAEHILTNMISENIEVKQKGLTPIEHQYQTLLAA